MVSATGEPLARSAPPPFQGGAAAPDVRRSRTYVVVVQSGATATIGLASEGGPVGFSASSEGPRAASVRPPDSGSEMTKQAPAPGTFRARIVPWWACRMPWQI